MTILLEQVTIKNFRSVENLELPLSAFTPLIGYNNAGKSNVISAIQWLLRRSVLSKSDFHASTAPVEVVGRVTGVTNDVIAAMPGSQQARITPYVAEGTLNIRRLQPSPLSKLTEVSLSVLNPATGEWIPNPTGIDAALAVLLPEPIRIAAMQDAAEDAAKAKTSTTIGKLLAEFLAPMRSAHEVELHALLHEVDRRLSSEGDCRFSELQTIEGQMSIRIAELFPGIGARLHFPVPAMDDLIRAGTLRLHDPSGQVRDFASYGHGTQRAVQMALIRYLAEVRRAQAPTPGTTLLLIDEPELYLHPFAIEQVRVALKSLAASGYQVVFSTHSAQLVSSADAQHALLIRKLAGNGTQARRRLPDAIQAIVPDSIHQMEQLFTLSNASQVLFADRAVLTEGKTELRLLPMLVESVTGNTLGHEKIALVPQSGVNDTRKSMKILAAMDIPCRAIVDLDFAFAGAIRDGFLAADDTDIHALIAILRQMATAGKITIDAATGLPKRGIVKASAAYALLAQEKDAAPHIHSLHAKLIAQEVWVWQLGAVEDHLGLADKTESHWTRFQISVAQDGYQTACRHPDSVADMIRWCVH